MHLPTTATVVQWLGLALCFLGLAACVRVSRVHFAGLDPDKRVELGVATVSVVAYYKLMALMALVALPAASVGVTNYHLFEGVKEVQSCARCHVMRPMVNDMRDPESDTLAARHFKNNWIANKQCYQCHTDYGLAGTMEAKMDGYRHLARYTTGNYEEPIKFRGVYSNTSCLSCHRNTPKFEAVPSHTTARSRLEGNTMSCLNCHGKAHPSRADRTPGSPRYNDLIELKKAGGH